MTTAAPVFRFSPAKHEYFLGDERIRGISELLDLGELVNGKLYYTEASRVRGSEVHTACMDFDLGTLDLSRVDGPYAGYVKGYADAVRTIAPDWHSIEVAQVHPGYRFAGRPDRVGIVWGRKTVLEIKSAAKAKHHPIQTALQVLLQTADDPTPAESWQRVTLYVKHSGKWSIDEHTDARDFDVAKALIRRFAQ